MSRTGQPFPALGERIPATLHHGGDRFSTAAKSGAELLRTVSAKPTPCPRVVGRVLRPLLCGLCHFDTSPRPQTPPTATDLAALPILLVQMSEMGEGGNE